VLSLSGLNGVVLGLAANSGGRNFVNFVVYSRLLFKDPNHKHDDDYDAWHTACADLAVYLTLKVPVPQGPQTVEHTHRSRKFQRN